MSSFTMKTHIRPEMCINYNPSVSIDYSIKYRDLASLERFADLKLYRLKTIEWIRFIFAAFVSLGV